ncbi:glutathione S-transferase family protein [Vibrio ponticus]|nr:glutathione S-transferase family protein [Vibrio ponticus]
MKLYLNDTSPFSRVALATALLTNVQEFELVWVDPWSSPTELLQVNPFSMIPALELRSGHSLIESLTICQYLIARFQPNAIQEFNLADEDESKRTGIAKTLMEISFKSVALGRFIDLPNELYQRAIEAVQRAMIELNQYLSEYQQPQSTPTIAPSLANLYLHCALDYVAFRQPELFKRYAQHSIEEFMSHSPFNEVLNHISVAKLASKPNFADLA